MKRKVKGILLGSFILLASFFGLESMENKVSAGVGQTFNENFPDSNLASIVAQKLSKAPGDTITSTDVEKLTVLSIAKILGLQI